MRRTRGHRGADRHEFVALAAACGRRRAGAAPRGRLRRCRRRRAASRHRPDRPAEARADGISDRHLRHPEVVRHLPGHVPARGRRRTSSGSASTASCSARRPGRSSATRPPRPLWGLRDPARRPTTAGSHLTVPPELGRARERTGASTARVPSAGDEVARRHPCGHLAQPHVADLAGVLPPPALLAVTDQMLARGFPAGRVPRASSPVAAGGAVSRDRAPVLPVADALAGSPMESVLRWLIHEAGLPRPVLQYVIRDAVGRFLGQVDLAWPDQRVLVEFDGDVHRDRRVFVERPPPAERHRPGRLARPAVHVRGRARAAQRSCSPSLRAALGLA